MTRRLVGFLAVLAVIAAITTSCKRERDQKLDVNAAIDKTERLARRFTYAEATRTSRTLVGGIVEDDFRYKAQLNINSRPVEEEVASDDAVAVRFFDPAQLPTFLDPAAAATVSTPVRNTGTDQPTLASPATVIQALSTGHWVLDKVGAPNVLGGIGGSQNRTLGQDPVVDALTTLEYVRQAVDRAVVVHKFSRDQIDPVWKGPEDPFPKPARGSATHRYDLKAPPLPNASQTAGTGNQTVPETAHFRKLVVYVRDGVVIQVQEQTSAQSKLHDLITAFRLPKDTTADQAIAAINVVRRGQGLDPIRIRNMTFQLTHLGDPLKVDLPTDAVAGSLTVIRNRGRQAATQVAQSAA